MIVAGAVVELFDQGDGADDVAALVLSTQHMAASGCDGHFLASALRLLADEVEAAYPDRCGRPHDVAVLAGTEHRGRAPGETAEVRGRRTGRRRQG